MQQRVFILKEPLNRHPIDLQLVEYQRDPKQRRQLLQEDKIQNASCLLLKVEVWLLKWVFAHLTSTAANVLYHRYNPCISQIVFLDRFNSLLIQ